MATKECIACAEQIQENAKLCRFCNTQQTDIRFVSDPKPITTAKPKAEIGAVLVSDEVRTICGSCGWSNAKINKRCTKCDAFLDHISGKFQVTEDSQLGDYSNGQVINLRGNLGPTPGIAIAAIIVAFLVPILGLILGYAARNEVRNPASPKEGDGLATGAIVIGWIYLVIFFIWIIAFASVTSTYSGY